MSQPVEAFDWARMLFGDQPPLFLLEIVFRTVVIYGYAFILVRWIGGRTVAQLSMIEFLLVIALGSAVGDPLFYPDVPLVHCLLVITAVVLLNKGLDFLVFYNRRAERLIDGRPVEIMKDGRIHWQTLASRKLGHSELFQLLRVRGIVNLGEVEAAYLEASGKLSIFRRENPRAGLPIVPPWEIEPPGTIAAGDPVPDGLDLACSTCGETVTKQVFLAEPACPRCGDEDWVLAARPAQPGRGGDLAADLSIMR